MTSEEGGGGGGGRGAAGSGSSERSFLGRELLDYVQRETGLGHRHVRSAVEATLHFLSLSVPSARHEAEALLEAIRGKGPSDKVLEGTHDWQRLRCIFSTIVDVKSDVEQLNWALHEDHHIILEFLEELVTLLTDGDPEVCRLFLQKDRYEHVEALVQYFHMETRAQIRSSLLKVFAALCTLDRVCITLLASTDLPLLLAKSILQQSTTTSSSSSTNHHHHHHHPPLQLTHNCCVLLTMLLWSGEPMPVTHFEVLNQKFVDFVLDVMEGDVLLQLHSTTEDNGGSGGPSSSSSSSFDEGGGLGGTGSEAQMVECCTELLLAFNLQFKKDVESNVVMAALASRNTAQELLAKLIILANREDDPVGDLFDHPNPPPNSVHKMLLDVFERRDTAGLFYTSDLKVLIEIVARKLLDLPTTDKTHFAYLQLASNIMANTNYAEHSHCKNDFQKCFDRILCHGNDDNDSCLSSAENEKEGDRSKALVRRICSSLPDIFHVVVDD